MPKYENIFSPETMDTLRGKSGESLRQMLGNKNILQAALETQGLFAQVIAAEQPYVDELEMLSVQMVKDIYPVIDHYGLEIDAKIIDMSDIDQQLDEELSPEQKRRIVNGITQGASVRGTFGFLLFREYIDNIDPNLVDKYRALMNNFFGGYDDDNAIAMFLAMIAQGHKMGGGLSKVIINELSINKQLTEPTESKGNWLCCHFSCILIDPQKFSEPVSFAFSPRSFLTCVVSDHVSAAIPASDLS